MIDRAKLSQMYAREQRDFALRHPRSAAAHQSADHLFGHVPMTWMNKKAGGFPVYFDRALGNRIWDVDGLEYADFALGDTGAMAGHSPAATVAAIQHRIGALGGITTMLPTEDAEWVGAELTRRFGLERRARGRLTAGGARVGLMTLSDKAATFLKLHTDPELLVLVNVWDAVSAKVVADSPGCRALATASHSIAASHGYPDGEKIPLNLMIDAIGRIVAAVDLPVSADLESGYEDVADTVRRAIGVGAVGANLEDAMRPLDESVTAVIAAVKAGEAEGIPFVLNARTDAFLKARDREPEAVLLDAIERGRAFLDAGAACVFVPGRLDAVTVGRLVAAIGQRKVSLIGVPGSLPSCELQRLGVARLSFGPWTQRATLTSLQDLSNALHAGGALPEGIRPLN
jgi:2-methylisocitrate lyase-like PEP mutase family enzyme